MANGGPLFVYVKDGKIVRMTPIEFDDNDPQPWTIKAKGKEFTPPRKTSLAPHGQTVKSTIYSPDRILYPMKRVDFDPNGERNPQNRGVSGYERISWDEALDIVAKEITRQKTVHGNGAIACSHPSHHAWGNIGYYLSALRKFENAIGMTEVHHNPDSWEGWYWGATHHWGGSMRVGQSETYGTVEDLLKEAEMVVFWSSNPESNSGAYGALEGTIRRQWLNEAGIKIVHIDPYFNDSIQLLGGKWIAPRPTSSPALALAIAYVWITEGTYDKKYVYTHTHGFEKWADYVLGKDDGIPKSPEWQEAETAVPASDVRALAREWASKKTYLGAGAWGNGHGGACRNATGIQWARTMVCLIAMQGLGKPGVNMGNLQWGTPLDFNFYFPGYAEGGMSGDFSHTAMGVTLYQRMPQLPSINTNTQVIPRMQLPDAIIDGKAEGYVWNGSSIEAQFQKITYPKPGLLAGAHAVEVRRLADRVDAGQQPLHQHVPAPESRVPREPEHLAARRYRVRGHHPAGLHELRALRHQRMGGTRRLRSPRRAAVEPSRHHLPAQVHRAARRIEVGFLDLPEDLRAAEPRGLFHRRRRRARLGETAIRWLGSAEVHFVEGVRPQGLLRGPDGERGAARAALVELVLRGQKERRAGADAAAVGLFARLLEGPANPERQDRVRVREPEALRSR